MRIQTASIISDDASIATPMVKLTGSTEEIIDRTRIEVLYSCSKTKSGRIRITLSIEADSCEPFVLEWFKHCIVETDSKLIQNTSYLFISYLLHL